MFRRLSKSIYATTVATASMLLWVTQVGAQETLTQKGEALYRQDKYSEAITLLTKAIEVNPKDDQAFRFRSACYMSTRQYKESLADCAAWSALSPREARPFERSAWIYVATGEYKRSIECADKAIERDPKNGDTYGYRGAAKFKLGDLAGALSDFSKQIEFESDCDNAYSNRASCHYELKQYEPALADTNQAIAILESRLKRVPDEPPPVDTAIGELYVLRSRIHLKMGQKQLAEQDNKKAMFHGVFASFSDER
ncbi:MAG: tetratricopeptide repeat protein [Candidatus Obscuribacterales bacterium]|nr:tetratricopeptide repeat protein [Candidatus Obscuribacterales bacterium]